MTDEDVARIRDLPIFATLDADSFPKHAPLDDVIKNDTRLNRYRPGDLVEREGDYGASAFLVISGRLRQLSTPGLPEELIGRLTTKKKSVLRALSQLWTNRVAPEVRDTRRYGGQAVRVEQSALAASRAFLQDVQAVLSEYDTVELGPGELFGELTMFGLGPRTATIFAEDPSELLEIRWQGLRELRRHDPGWRRVTEARYRDYKLQLFIDGLPLFDGLNTEQFQAVREASEFETHAAAHIDWSDIPSRGKITRTTVVARQGEYADSIMIIAGGLARVSVSVGEGERTLTHLRRGDMYGFDELWAGYIGSSVPRQTTLTAVGYLDVLRIPKRVLWEQVFGDIKAPPVPLIELAGRSLANSAMQDWICQEFFTNGTMAMLIDTHRCVRCDDCVRACASAHGGNPRFLRHGKTFHHWMVANACMHCVEPLCMVGCPTGAIHQANGGAIVIHDDTCVGCGTCANSCPYNNIRLVDIRALDGRPVVDEMRHIPIRKATKCDLCIDNPGGPACVRACPHDALTRVDFLSEEGLSLTRSRAMR
jgi:Fe-S-cluster-containing dehydrogenase component/CRP-like cAMP-binding protein